MANKRFIALLLTAVYAALFSTGSALSLRKLSRKLEDSTYSFSLAVPGLSCDTVSTEISSPYSIVDIDCGKKQINFKVDGYTPSKALADEFLNGISGYSCSTADCASTGPTELNFYAVLNLGLSTDGVQYQLENFRVGQTTMINEETGETEFMYWVGSESCTKVDDVLHCELVDEPYLELRLYNNVQTNQKMGGAVLRAARRLEDTTYTFSLAVPGLSCDTVSTKIASPYSIVDIDCSNKQINFKVDGYTPRRTIARRFLNGISGYSCSTADCASTGPTKLNFYAVLDLGLSTDGVEYQVENFRVGQTTMINEETGETESVYWVGSEGCTKVDDVLHCELTGDTGLELRLYNNDQTNQKMGGAVLREM